MSAIKSHLKQFFRLLFIAMLFLSCSTYHFYHLSINGKTEHILGKGNCRVFMKANQVETLGIVNLQLQVLKGMVVHTRSLKLTIDDEPISQEQVNIRYAGKRQLSDFIIHRSGTLTLSLDKSTVAGHTRIVLLPCEFLRCNGSNIFNEQLQFQLKN
jgi:hypothetical protein